MGIKNYADIPSFTRGANYQVDISLDYLERALASYLEQGLDLDPDFQRGHVWTETQQVAWLEFVFRGGESGRDILSNKPDWHNHIPDGAYNEFVLVDGKQRLTAALRFLRNEIKIFGSYRREIAGHMRFHRGLKWHVNDLKTRAEVLQWYLDFNAGGVVHADSEIEKVRSLLEQEHRLV